MSGEYPRGVLEYFNDFLVDNGNGASGLTETVSGASMDAMSKHGGWCRITGSTGAGDYALLTGELVYEVDEGHPLILEVRLTSNLVANTSVFVGFTDAVGDTTMPIEYEDAAIDAHADD